MKTKTLLIPVAAFALFAAGNVQAFNEDVLKDAGFSDDQIAALEAAKELRDDGDRKGARDLIVDSGITFENMQDWRAAIHEMRVEMATAIDEAIANDDYAAFQDAIAGTELAEHITSEADFELFAEAHELREAGDYAGARAIMQELGIEPQHHRFGHMMRHHHMMTDGDE